MNSMSEWVISVLQCYEADMEVASRYYDDFECSRLDDEDEMKQLIRWALDENVPLVNLILDATFREVVDRAVSELGVDESDMDYYVNALDSNIYYKHEEVNSWEELVEMVNKDKKGEHHENS